LNPRRLTVVYTDDVNGVKNCKYMFSDQCEFMAVFMVFNLWIGSGFNFESCS